MRDVLQTANFHRIGGIEMAEFPLSDCFVAEFEGRIVGVGGYKVLSPTTAKTTLLAVDPDVGGRGVGKLLQDARFDYLKSIGVRTVTTNTDDPKVIAWLERSYGFRPTGETIPKEENFGKAHIDRWTTMQVNWD